MLRTIEDGFGLSSYLGNASDVTPINTTWYCKWPDHVFLKSLRHRTLHRTGTHSSWVSLKLPFKRIEEPANLVEPNVLSMIDGSDGRLLEQWPHPKVEHKTKLEKTPNITTIPDFDRFAEEVAVEILLKADISTDDIIPAASQGSGIRISGCGSRVRIACNNNA